MLHFIRSCEQAHTAPEMKKKPAIVGAFVPGTGKLSNRSLQAIISFSNLL